MSSVDKLFKLADRLARKISLGQSAQPGDIQSNLQEARLWDLTNDLFPLLDQADIPAGVPVHLDIVVDSNFNVTYPVKTKDAAKGQKLSVLVKSKYGQAMSDALKKGTIKDSFGKVLGPFRVVGPPKVASWLDLK